MTEELEPFFWKTTPEMQIKRPPIDLLDVLFNPFPLLNGARDHSFCTKPSSIIAERDKWRREHKELERQWRKKKKSI